MLITPSFMDLPTTNCAIFLDPKEVHGEDFPRETFRELKDKEIRLYVELANRDSLEYVLDEIHGSLYGQEPNPDFFQKAGLIAWRIIIGQIFHDGNK
jgi:hypothetical protein